MMDDQACTVDGIATRRGRRTSTRTWAVPGSALVASLVLVAAACTPPPTGPPKETPPVAVAVAEASAGPAPFAAEFSSVGSIDYDGTIVSYAWDFGDGTTSTDANPAKTYSTVGDYTVSLTVTDDDGLSASVAPFTVNVYTPGDPSSLAYFPQLSRSVGLIEDKIAVWTCKVTGSSGPVHDPVATAAWAQDIADQYFGVVSRGRYHPVFTAVGTFEISPTSYTQSDCLQAAEERTDSPYTNVMAVDTTLVGGGLGGGGSVYANGTGLAPTDPPSVSGRGFVVGGGSYSELPGPDVVVHEMGHTLHWPHSYLTPSNQYDNYEDVMSARPSVQNCSIGDLSYSCHPQHTLAFNRWAAGWVDADQVVVHTNGTQQVDLSGPESTTGVQLVVAPSSSSSRALVTVEARPQSGFDQYLATGGVAVHVVDQRSAMCNVASFDGCPGLWRRQGQASGPPFTYEHVIAPGASKTVDGLTITVNAVVGSGYNVTVSGTPLVATNALLPMPSLLAGLRGTDGDGHGGVGDGGERIYLH